VLISHTDVVSAMTYCVSVSAKADIDTAYSVDVSRSDLMFYSTAQEKKL